MRKKHLLTVAIFLISHSAGFTQGGQTAGNRQDFIDTLLQHHNAYRITLHLPPLVWSADLASDAQTWATKLAKMNKGQHDASIRGKEGENIWWGTAGAFSSGEMAEFWANERQEFVYGTFPDCRTSSAAVVGHYTQMIWKNTQAVGCALVGNGKMDYLVCRYSAPGNVVGEKPY